MELTDKYLLPVDRQTVWNALNDAQTLKSCIAGCERFERTGENEFACAVTATIGPVTARFNAKLHLTDIDMPNHYSIYFDGQGGPAGFGKGSARVDLTDDAGGTVLSYQAHAQVGGRLAQVGSRLIDGVAKKLAGDFFTKFSDKLGGSKVVPPAPEAKPHVTIGAVSPPDTQIPRWLIIVGAVGLVTVLFVLTHH